ncbi:ARF guanine-nucleotide exchange factor GNL2-like [Apium graveolens]|uniref:ARF guanine-nucleotide exchange factor GNL2-like n=1 Tax=Apium graveolens TaxID=4045 RepID=UPI003D7903D4
MQGGEKENERMSGVRRREFGRACMLNTEVGAVLAAIRRKTDLHPHYFSQEDSYYDSSILQSLKSLRSLIFSPQQEWNTIDPSIYLSPFLDVLESDDVPATATAVALSAILKIFRNNLFDERTPGAKHAMAGAVTAITSCRLEKTDSVSEDSVMMRILYVLTELVRHPASVLLSDHSICTIVNTCFQVVQQSANRGALLQRTAMYTMHELVQIIFARLPDIDVKDEEISDSDDEDTVDPRYGIRSAVDIFHFLCSLLNVVQVYHGEYDPAQGALPRQSFDEDVQLFALVLINSVIELSGDSIMNHPKLLRMVQDDLFHHLIYYGTRSTPLILSMISSIVLNIYHFLRRSVRLQLEAFFSFVLLRAASIGNAVQVQEVAIEGIINFCRQPTFIIEAYVNYDTHPTFRNVFQELGKLLCMHAFPANGPLTSLQIQAFEGLIIILQNIADSVDKEDNSSPLGEYPIEVSEYRPFWEEISTDSNSSESWVDFVRIRKAQKRKITIASNHYNRDDKKGLDYLKVSQLVSDPPVAKAFAMFFRFTPGLDKTMIGEYLGDPEEFHLQVLKEFTETFEFAGMALDSALRTYLESFRLPGESQKIHRIIEAFSNQYYDQQTSDTFQNGSAVLVLSYSLIMLNTDQHNPQVKKKMTEDEFIRNNRSINDGKDLPREYLSGLFHSIATKEITVFGQNGMTIEMSPNIWIQLINRSKKMQSFTVCNTDRTLGRDMFAVIAGPSVATLSAIFEHSEEEEMLHECTEGLFSIARIAQYGLEDTLDELLASLCKFTTLLNPYASADETLYGFTNDMKPRMATLAVFAIANSFKESIRGGWRNIVDCLLKLKRLKLLPSNVVDPDNVIESSDSAADEDLESPDARQRQCTGLIGRFSHFLSMESVEESLNLGLSEFEQNQKVIQQCRIGCIFNNSSNLSNEALQDLGRSLIFAAAGKGQKFSTPVEEEETVAFCWDLLLTMTLANVNRFSTFWPNYHDYLLTVAQFPMFSPIPFVEKGIIALVKVSNRILATYRPEKVSEELIFTSINLMWKLEKEILDTCFEFLTIQMSKILTKSPANIQTQLGWKSVLHLLSITGRHQETYEKAVETLIFLMSDGTHIYRTNYIYCIDCAFGFVALRNSPVETNKKIMDLMAESVKNLVEWYRSGYSDPGSNTSNSSSADDNSKALASSNFTVNLFVRLGEALRKTSLARREGIRNHAITSLQRSFTLAEGLYFSPSNIISSLNLVLFAMVDDLHEKMLEYSRRENAEKETRSMEGTLKLSMVLLTNVYLQFLKPISESPGFKTFWLGILRRMDTCMKADLGVYGVPDLQEMVPDLLRKIIIAMKDKNLLVPTEGDDLWEITYIQIQWIAPSVKDELFPDV